MGGACLSAVLLMVACGPEVDENGVPRGLEGERTAKVRRLGSGERVSGPQARGREGDIELLTGDGVRFVLSDLSHREGFQRTGGNLIDVHGRHGGDRFGGMSTWFAEQFPRQAAYERMTLLKKGVVVEGHDVDDPRIAVRTTWTLVEPKALGVQGRLHIRTEVELREGPVVEDYALGDIVAWGSLSPFAPGPGHKLAGTRGELPWVAAQGDHDAILLIGDAPLRGPHGSAWSDPIWSTHRLEPGRPIHYDRDIYVGRSIAELAEAAALRRGERVVTAAGTVRERGGVPIGGVDMLVERIVEGRAEPYIAGRTDSIGLFRPALPKGRFRISASSATRTMGAPHEVEIEPAEGQPFWTIEASPQGRVELEARGPAGEILPARFQFTGVDGTATPNFGPTWAAIGGDRVNVRTTTGLRIAPGRYDVDITHGPAWSVAHTTIDVGNDGKATPVAVTLAPIADLKRWRQCDLHVHSQYSADSAVPPRDALVATVAEGLDCFATTDHDAVADWSADLLTLGLQDSLLWWPGLEVTAEPQGHWNVYPWPVASGPFDHHGLLPDAIVAGLRTRAPKAILQLNHPLSEGNGLFAWTGLDAETGWPLRSRPDGAPTGATTDWDVIEVLNGKYIDEAKTLVDRWIGWTRRGHRSAIVGNSDSHRIIGQERGLSRTWVRVEDRSEAALRAGIDAGLTVASTGPLIELDRGGHLKVRLSAQDGVDFQRLTVKTVRRGTDASPGEVTVVTTVGEADGTGSRGGGVRTWTWTGPAVPDDVVVIAILEGDKPQSPWSPLPAFVVAVSEPRPSAGTKNSP